MIAALSASALWEQLDTDWVCLDAELMPWSAKAQSLIAEQYEPVGIAAIAATEASLEVVGRAAARGVHAQDLEHRLTARACNARAYDDVYRHYAWPVVGIEDLKLAPFHIMASKHAVHIDLPHTWHMQTLATICATDPAVLITTPHRLIDLSDAGQREAAITSWEELTGRGGEGMVIKPDGFVARGPRGLVQPALKCRGREYLRIIYGPDYTLPEHLSRLRERGLGGKRALALREFALGI